MLLTAEPRATDTARFDIEMDQNDSVLSICNPPLCKSYPQFSFTYPHYDRVSWIDWG
jgi:hypothetical protein